MESWSLIEVARIFLSLRRWPGRRSVSRFLAIERRDNGRWQLPGGVVSLVFLCRPVGGQARATGEATKAAWLTCDEVSGLMPEAFSIRLLDALRIADPAVRTHDGEHLLGPDSV
ncbi:hypothetical protein [Streptosporangium sp. V21-05]|uniref:hypothetical protein n=1 Tax=Streptosporangium sp. V21-05 TaxID=3446115 RepID=UPI003F5355CF